MQKIPLKLAKPGMVLAKPVLRDNGLVLMAEGAELSQALLDRLERMEVGSITVKGNPVDMEGASGGTQYAKVIERLDHLFRKYKSDPFMNKLKVHLRNYFQVKAAAEAAALAAEENDESGEEA